MNDAMKVKVASAVTALFLGGIAAAGLLSRSNGEDAAAGSPQTQVIHRKKVRTVTAPSAPGTVPVASYAPAPATAPSPVSTRVSPTGDDDEGEREAGEESESE